MAFFNKIVVKISFMDKLPSLLWFDPSSRKRVPWVRL